MFDSLRYELSDITVRSRNMTLKGNDINIASLETKTLREVLEIYVTNNVLCQSHWPPSILR